jgi:hypothetical protein
MKIPDIRIADPSDTDRLRELCYLLHAEVGLLPLDEELVEELLYAFTSHQPTPHCANPGMAVVVDGPDGRPVAVLTLRVNQLWYSRQPFLEELFNFVHPQHRRSIYAKTLVKYARSMADNLGIPLMMGVATNVRTEAKVDLYRRLLPYTGAFFIYDSRNRKEDKAAA